MKADKIFAVEKFEVQDLLLICEELGISACPAITKEAALDVNKIEDGTVEEADEAWETIVQRRQKANKIVLFKFKLQDLLLIGEDLDISPGFAITKEVVLDVMAAEDVTVEEADEAWEATIERKERAEECERRQYEVVDRREEREQEAARLHGGECRSLSGSVLNECVRRRALAKTRRPMD